MTVSAVQRILMAFAALLGSLLVAGSAAATTTSEAGVFTYDVQTNDRVAVHEFEDVDAGTAHLSGQQDRSVSSDVEGWGTSTTPSPRSVATNTVDDAFKSVDDVVGGLSPGRQPHVRTVSSTGELQTVYNDLAAGGVPTEWSGYKGTVVRRPDGVEVGLRGTSTSGGATIDIRLPDGTTQKVHIAG